MSEDKRVVAGEAILSGVATIRRNEAEHSRADSNHDVLERLVREHSRLVYRIAYAVLRAHHDAEDSTQETFLRVLRYSSKLRRWTTPRHGWRGSRGASPWTGAASADGGRRFPWRIPKSRSVRWLLPRLRRMKRYRARKWARPWNG